MEAQIIFSRSKLLEVAILQIVILKKKIKEALATHLHYKFEFLLLYKMLSDYLKFMFKMKFIRKKYKIHTFFHFFQNTKEKTIKSDTIYYFKTQTISSKIR